MFCLVIPGAKVYLFRRTFPQLAMEIIPRLRARLNAIATYNSSQHAFTFPNGSILRCASLANDADLLNYQGAEITLALFDELTQFTRDQYTYIRSRLRVAGEPAVAMAERGWKPRMIATSNPTGPGTVWVKEMFVDPSPGPDIRFDGGIQEGEDPAGLRRMCYIPALSSDNPYLDHEAYERELAGLGDPELIRALKYGDWTILRGTRFSQFRAHQHVIKPEQLPIPLIGYPRAIGVDWGISAPFAALWGALVGETIVIYREIGGAGFTAAQQVQMILDAEAPEERSQRRPLPVALDPSCWARPNDQLIPPPDTNTPTPGSVAWYYHKALGGQLVKAWNDRIPGWQLVDQHLLVQADGLPRLLIYDTCRNLIKTLPALLRSTQRPEDVGTSPKQNDHYADACRYLLGQLIKGGHDRTTVSKGSLAGELLRPDPADLVMDHVPLVPVGAGQRHAGSRARSGRPRRPAGGVTDN